MMVERVHSPLSLLEIHFLIDRALASRRRGLRTLSGDFARAAEGILKSSLPHLADDIAAVASCKGKGDVIGGRLAQHLDASSAACLALVLLLRGARKRVVDTLASVFRDDPEFNATIRMLCGRVFEPTATAIASQKVGATTIEVAAPRRR